MMSKRGSPTPFDRVISAGGQRKAGEASFATRVLLPLVDRVTSPSNKLLKSVDRDAIRLRLMRGGFPRGLTANQFLFIKVVLPVLFAIPFGLIIAPAWANAMSIPLGWTFIGGLLFGGLYGWKMPDIWLNSIIRKRQLDIQLSLPDVIDLVTVSVEAGLGLDASLYRVASRFPNALSEEIMRAMQEVRLGRSRIESLRDMAKRADVPDLSAWVTALVQAELLGVSIANVLRVQSERLREKRSQRAREQAQKAPIKMVFPLVLFIFPALFVVILGPAALIVIHSNW